MMAVRQRYKINTYYLPDAKTEYVLNFNVLGGGLNIYDLDYRLEANESPSMKNLNWNDGVLSSRDGQIWVSSDTTLGVGHASFQDLFWGNMFFHIGAKLYRLDPEAGAPALVELYSSVPEVKGTFFRYGDWLLYKTKGAYLKVSYDPAAAGEKFSVAAVSAYTPIIQINTDPATHAGDLYQPENRMSAQKTVKYNAAADVSAYHLPAAAVDSIDKVVVDGAETTAYTADLAAGVVTFTTAPPVTTPATNNTVEITYSKANTDAYNSVMDCRYAAVFGGDANVCVVLGGCPAQPNAYFWCSNDNLSMNIGYFPVPYYNFAGDSSDSITGFGKQQNLLVIFKEHSIGKATFSTTKVNDRETITMDYKAINSRIGCDLPWTIQLVDNNLVFCNTQQGVHIIRDSSTAYENNIVGISLKVNGGENHKTGLLDAIRAAAADAVCSVDNDRRYWVCVSGDVYEWDYQLSTYKAPTWFYHSGIAAAAFVQNADKLWHLDTQGRITAFARVFSDYGGAIEKYYQFPTQHFGSYDRLKDVTRVEFATRSDTDSTAAIRWSCDYMDAEDPTRIVNWSNALAPRNLAHRSLNVRRYAGVATRKPGLRRIRHFTMRLSNNQAGEDLSIISAQIFYKFQGRDR